jgi:hypothetical protein
MRGAGGSSREVNQRGDQQSMLLRVENTRARAGGTKYSYANLFVSRRSGLAWREHMAPCKACVYAGRQRRLFARGGDARDRGGLAELQ